jgi:hypothetical protein
VRALAVHDLSSHMGRRLLVAELDTGSGGLVVDTVHLESLKHNRDVRAEQFDGIFLRLKATGLTSCSRATVNTCSSWATENANLAPEFVDLRPAVEVVKIIGTTGRTYPDPAPGWQRVRTSEACATTRLTGRPGAARKGCGSMEFLHSQVETRSGNAIEVSLEGNAANVLVMDSSNFSSYRRGGRIHYYGGHFTRSPAIIRPPSSGTWHVVIDLGGRRGHVRASVRVI